ncbi:putative aspartic peptidase domain superfamily [Dioscorea sansibarensis]
MNPPSLRLLGESNHSKFIVLIDSGSTHNFIKPALAEKPGLAIQPTAKLHVFIGNGAPLLCQFVCPQVTLTL